MFSGAVFFRSGTKVRWMKHTTTPQIILHSLILEWLLPDFSSCHCFSVSTISSFQNMFMLEIKL